MVPQRGDLGLAWNNFLAMAAKMAGTMPPAHDDVVEFSDDTVCPVVKAPKFDIERSPLSNQINYIRSRT